MNKIKRIRYFNDLLIILYQNHLFFIDLLHDINVRKKEHIFKGLFNVNSISRSEKFKILETNIKDFECSELTSKWYFLYYITIDNKLYGTGRNDYQQIDNSETTFGVAKTFICDDVDAITIYDTQLFVLKTNGDVFTRGGHLNYFKDLTKIYSDAIKIISKMRNLLILTKSNKLVCMDFSKKNFIIKEIQLDNPITHLEVSGYIYFIQNKNLLTFHISKFYKNEQIKVTLDHFEATLIDNNVDELVSCYSAICYFKKNNKIYRYGYDDTITYIGHYDFVCDGSYRFSVLGSVITIQVVTYLKNDYNELNLLFDLAWSLQNHKCYPDSVRQSIVIMMMFFRRLKLNKKIVIDKRLIYDIFKLIF